MGKAHGVQRSEVCVRKNVFVTGFVWSILNLCILLSDLRSNQNGVDFTEKLFRNLTLFLGGRVDKFRVGWLSLMMVGKLFHLAFESCFNFCCNRAE